MSYKRNHEIETHKAIVLGDFATGKTSIIERFLNKRFNQNTFSTIGATFSSVTRIKGNGATHKLDIWDTAGQERYRSIINLYYKGSSACILVCDLTDPSTIGNLTHWIEDIIQKNDNTQMVTLIVGNKVDLMPTPDVPPQLAEIANKYNYPVILTSAKEGTNIEKIFEMMFDLIFDQPKPLKNDQGLLNIQNNLSSGTNAFTNATKKLFGCRF